MSPSVYALQFNGDSDYAVLDSVENFPENSITIAFWVRTTANNRGTFFSYATPGAANMVMIRNAANLEFFLGIRNGFRTNISLNDGDWHHLAMTWQQQTGAITVYVDGEERTSGTINRGQALVPNGSLILGQDQDQVGGGFEAEEAYAGDLADVQIWNQVLSVDDIRRRLNRSDALVAYWSFDGSNDPIALDRSLNRNHLTLNGGQTVSVDLPLPELPPADHDRFGQQLAQALTSSTTERQLNLGSDELAILGEFGESILQLWNRALDAASIRIRDVNLIPREDGIVIEGRVNLLNLVNLSARFEFLSTNQFTLRLLLPNSWQFSNSLQFLPGVGTLDGLSFSNPFCIISSIDGGYTQANDAELPVAQVRRENGLNFYITLDVSDNQPLNDAYQILEEIFGFTAQTDALLFRASLGGLINIPRIPDPQSRAIASNNRVSGTPDTSARERQRRFTDNLYFVLATDILGDYRLPQVDAVSFTNLSYGLRLGLADGEPELQVFNACTALVDTPDAEPLTFVGSTQVITDGQSLAVSGFLRLEGEWVNPLGLRHVTIGDDPNRDAIVPGPQGSAPRVAGMEVGIGFNPNQRIPLPILGVIGRLQIDLPGADDVDWIGGVRFNGQNIFESVLWTEQEEFAITRLGRTALSLFNDAVSLPEPLEQFFTGLESFLESATLRDLYCYVVPQSTTFVGTFFRRGIYARGRANLYGFEAQTNLSIDELSGMTYHGVMDPIAVELIPDSGSVLRLEWSQNFATVDRFTDIELSDALATGPEIRLVMPLPGVVTLPVEFSEFLQEAENVSDVESAIATINSAPVQNQIERLISPIGTASGYISTRLSLFDIAQDTLVGLQDNNLWFVLEGNLGDLYEYSLTYVADTPPTLGPISTAPTLGPVSTTTGSLFQRFYLAGDVAFDINVNVGPIRFQGIPITDRLSLDTYLSASLTMERQLLFFSTTIGGRFEFNGFEFELSPTTAETPRELRNIEEQAIAFLQQQISDVLETVATEQTLARLGIFFRDVYGRTFTETAQVLAQATYTLEQVIQVLAGAGADVVTIAQIIAEVFGATAAVVAAALQGLGYTLTDIGLVLRQAFDLGVRTAANLLYDLDDRLSLVSQALLSAGYEAVSVGRTLVAIFDGADRWPRAAAGAIAQWSDAAFRAVTTWSDVAWDATLRWPSSAWRATTQWIDVAWDSTTQWSDNAWDSTVQWTTAAWRQSVEWTEIGWDAIATWPDPVWDATTEWTAGRWAETVGWTTEIWTDVDTLALTTIDEVANAGEDALRQVAEIQQTAINAISQVQRTALETIGRTTNSGLGQINRALDGAIGQIRRAGSDAVSRIEDVARDIVDTGGNVVDDVLDGIGL
ncbi:MAG: LamG-like jellyroll fold domain-containing protein [Cyanobacteria bacterium P01_F01_bin.150]